MTMKPKTPADDEIILKKSDVLALKLSVAIAPEVHARRLHPATLSELTRRAAESGKFDLTLGGDLRERQSVGEWMDSTLADPKAAHLAQTFGDEPERVQREGAYGGMSREAFENLPARRKLDVANQMALVRRKSA